MTQTAPPLTASNVSALAKSPMVRALQAPLPAQVLSGGAVRIPLMRARPKTVGDQVVWSRVLADGTLEAGDATCVEIGPDEDLADVEYEVYYVALKFNTRTLAAIEERFGGAEAWQEALQTKTQTTVMATIAAATGKDEAEVMVSMLENASERYVALIQAAWMGAAGMDPTQARRFLSQLEKTLKEQRAKAGEIMDQELEALKADQLVSLGNDGSSSG